MTNSPKKVLFSSLVEKLSVLEFLRVINRFYKELMFYIDKKKSNAIGLISYFSSRKLQRQFISDEFFSSKNKLTVFFVPYQETPTGGDMQIFTLYRILRKRFRNTDEGVVICWLPGDGFGRCLNTSFKNNAVVMPVNLILENISNNCELQFHLCEFAAMRILKGVGWGKLKQLKINNNLKINILNQNIDQMLSPENVEVIKKEFPALTSTACNPGWVVESERQRLGIPIHLIPTWYYPDEAARQPYETKRDLMIVSHDYHPKREEIIHKIRMQLPHLDVVIIDNIPYEKYLEYEMACKWSITFGEGCDGYFYGPVLRGAIAFAVYNSTFDSLGLEHMYTTYKDYDEMADQIIDHINKLDSKHNYEQYNQYVRAPLASFMGYEATSNALFDFMKGNYTLP